MTDLPRAARATQGEGSWNRQVTKQTEDKERECDAPAQRGPVTNEVVLWPDLEINDLEGGTLSRRMCSTASVPKASIAPALPAQAGSTVKWLLCINVTGDILHL